MRVMKYASLIKPQSLQDLKMNLIEGSGLKENSVWLTKMIKIVLIIEK